MPHRPADSTSETANPFTLSHALGGVAATAPEHQSSACTALTCTCHGEVHSHLLCLCLIGLHSAEWCEQQGTSCSVAPDAAHESQCGACCPVA
jgi:hypothetical protein